MIAIRVMIFAPQADINMVPVAGLFCGDLPEGPARALSDVRLG